MGEVGREGVVVPKHGGWVSGDNVSQCDQEVCGSAPAWGVGQW